MGFFSRKNYSSPEDSTFQAFLKQSGLSENSKQAAVLKAMWLKGDKPFIKSYPKGALIEEAKKRWNVDADWDRAFFTRGRWKREPITEQPFRRFFNPGKYPSVQGTKLTPDTTHVREGDPSSLIAELTHGIQTNAPVHVRDSLLSASQAQRDKYGEGVYSTPGTYEHQAHRIMEPIWDKRFEDAYEPSFLEGLLDRVKGWWNK